MKKVFYELLIASIFVCTNRLPAMEHFSAKKLNQKLLQAIESNNPSEVHSLLENGAHANIRDENLLAPLHIAALEEKPRIVAELLQAQALPDIEDTHGATPLHLAACNGNLAVVHLLLKTHADKNARDLDYRTPLHTAAHHNHPSVAHLLITTGADMNACDLDGNTPLHIATYCCNRAMVELLCNSGACIDIKNKRKDTPIQINSAIIKQNKSYSKLEIYKQYTCIRDILSNLHLTEQKTSINVGICTICHQEKLLTSWAGTCDHKNFCQECITHQISLQSTNKICPICNPRSINTNSSPELTL